MEKKAIIAVSNKLPVGLKANIAAVLCMSLGKSYPDLVGPPAITRDGVTITGITTIPVPILEANPEQLFDLFNANSLDLVVPFNEAAMTTKNYSDYQAKLLESQSEELQVHGILLYGDRKTINKLAGQLPLLK